MKQLLFLLTSFVIAFSGCVSHEVAIKENGAKLLSQNELEMIFSKPLTIEYTSPGIATQIFSPDGFTNIEIKGYKPDNGTYKISEGLYCSTWENNRKNEKCFKIYQIDENEYHLITADGSLDSKGFLKK